MTQGRCGSLLLHRDGLPPSTPCRSPGALRFTPETGHDWTRPRCPLCAKSTHRDESRRDESAKMFVAIRLANPPAGLALGL